MKATRRSEAPVETMRDESSLMIIEEEVEAMDGNGRKGKNVVKVVQLFLRWVAVTWNPLGEDHLSQRKKAGRVEAKETSRESWGLNYFEKFGAHHVGCVGGDVNDGGDVEENHDLPCNLSIDWNATNSSTRTATNNILSCYYCGFLFFSTSIYMLRFPYFFWIHGHPAHTMWVFYWVSDNSRSWICVKISNVFLRYSCKNFFPRMLCCEASIIKSGFITDNQTLN